MCFGSRFMLLVRAKESSPGSFSRVIKWWLESLLILSKKMWSQELDRFHFLRDTKSFVVGIGWYMTLEASILLQTVACLLENQPNRSYFVSRHILSITEISVRSWKRRSTVTSYTSCMWIALENERIFCVAITWHCDNT